MAVGRDGKGWGGGIGVGEVTLCHSAGEVHTDLLAFASLQGIPRGLQLLPPVLRLRPGKRHHHILCTCRPGRKNCCWMVLWPWAATWDKARRLRPPMQCQSVHCSGVLSENKVLLGKPTSPLGLGLPHSLARVGQQPCCTAVGCRLQGRGSEACSRLHERAKNPGCCPGAALCL